MSTHFAATEHADVPGYMHNYSRREPWDLVLTMLDYTALCMHAAYIFYNTLKRRSNPNLRGSLLEIVTQEREYRVWRLLFTWVLPLVNVLVTYVNCSPSVSYNSYRTTESEGKKLSGVNSTSYTMPIIVFCFQNFEDTRRTGTRKNFVRPPTYSRARVPI